MVNIPTRRLDAERLRELLDYDPATGIFRWRVRRSFTAQANSIAGCTDDGYIRIYVDNKPYRAHHLAWLYMTGEYPTQTIDHRDLVGTNNVWTNLREATDSQQSANRGVPKNNKSGVKGVHFCKTKKRWIAHIGENGRRKTIGHFDSKEAAAAARNAAAERLFGEFARTQ